MRVTKIFAHRGLHLVEPENTIASFLEAKAVGADGVELDVRRTRDGALVVHHDAEIKGCGLICELDCRDLPRSVPTLSDAMIALDGLVVNVEIKNSPEEADFDGSGALASRVVSELRDAKYLDSVIISSFDLDTCAVVRSLEPDLAVGWLLDWKLPTMPLLIEAARQRFSAVHPHFRHVTPEFMAAARELGLAVNTWTVNSPEDLTKMLNLEVDAIISDDPELALRLRSECSLA